MAGKSTDGDGRAVLSMKQMMKSMMGSTNTDVLFDVDCEQDESVVQDPHHIATKLRNRMLRSSVALPMGRKQVAVSHLKILIETIPKDVHGLVKSDILPEDRQNFRSFEKITESRVLQGLEQYVIDSEATVMFLKISKQIVSAFTDINLEPLERVYRIWHSLYYMRAWRKWIQRLVSEENTSNHESIQHNTEKNFISLNAFTCTEINAYNLLHLIIKFRDANTPEYFLPTLFQSQACEQTFRQLRSMTTMNWTKINFSLLEMIQQISRIELQNHILFHELAKVDIKFPRIQNRSNKLQINQLPTNEQISEKLQLARNNALLDAANIGMTVSANDIIRCELAKGNIRREKTVSDHTLGELNGELEEDIELQSRLQCSSLRDYSKPDTHSEDLDSRFVEVTTEDGSVRTVLKSSLIWIMTETKGVLSNDRLKRVQNHDTVSTKRKQKKQSDQPFKRKKFDKNNQAIGEVGIFQNTELNIGDWCCFKNHDANETLVNAKTEKERSYSLDYCSISCQQNQIGRGIEVLATWYKYTNSEKLEAFPKNSNFFLNINSYKATVCVPHVKKDSESNTYYELKEFSQIKEYLNALC